LKYHLQRKKYKKLGLPQLKENIKIKKVEDHPGDLTYYEVKNMTLKIFCEFFAYQKLDVTDNFKKLGGDSLAAINILAKIESKLKCKITVDEIFSAENIDVIIEIILSLTSTFGLNPL